MRRKAAQDRHDTIGHVGVQGIVAAQGQDAMFFRECLALKPGLPHFDAERLGFVRA